MCPVHGGHVLWYREGSVLHLCPFCGKQSLVGLERMPITVLCDHNEPAPSPNRAVMRPWKFLSAEPPSALKGLGARIGEKM